MLRASKLNLLIIPLAALAAISPLLIHGISCGQDMPFHLQSWLDAAAQLRHGQYPHWASSPAWNAGEPRFLFYPPLSWLLGALLTALLPISAAPIAYIFLALTASGFSMYHFAKHYVSPKAALFASSFYLANPYMLFCAFERTAFAELLAAAWIPLLLLAILRPRPTVRGIAIPIALLWLTNAPAAVMGCYTFALIATLRVCLSLIQKSVISTGGAPLRRSGETPVFAFRLATTYVLGTILGLALPAFYLVPAAYERRFVQVAMAVIPNMRYQDNFLFTRTADAAHNAVNHTASTLALTILGLTVLVISALLLGKKSAVISTEVQRSGETPVFLPAPKLALALLTILIALLLVPLSTPIWAHLPNLDYLQFPWRLLTILSAVLAFAIALSLNTLGAPGPDSRIRVSLILIPITALIIPIALSFTAYTLYAQACDHPSLPTSIAALFKSHHGAPPTDEYTPTDADNDLLRTNNPAYWLPQDPNASAPNTIPTPSELNPNLATDDTPIPDSQTLSIQTPHHFVIYPTKPGYLILNLRDYPAWDVAIADECSMERYHPAHIKRDDGLIAVQLCCGTKHDIDITWHRTLDQTLGLITSALALIALALMYRTRQINP